MKKHTASILALAAAAAGHAGAASVVVDWLVTRPDATASDFTLVNDANTATASGTVAFTKGVGFPGLPVTRFFAAGNFSTLPEWADTVTGDASFSGMEFRVVPVAGAADYAINLRIPSNQPLILVVGGLLKNNISATGRVEIAALSDSAFVPVTLRSTNAWSNGVMTLNQGVAWDPLAQVLSTTAATNGDSQFAFFDIGALAGANPRVSLAVPSGYAAGSGDSIFIGLATVIPEPAAAGLWALGAGLLAWRRSRRVAVIHGRESGIRTQGFAC
jgi:hypothetical protein